MANYSEQIDFLAEQLLEKNVVFFFGAGASISSGLPVAWKVVEDILLKLSDVLPENRKEVYKRIKELSRREKLPRFETLISCLVSSCGDAAYNILDIFETAKPNLSHKVIAKLISHGYVQTHFTTNFDNLLEQALTCKADSIYEPFELEGKTTNKKMIPGINQTQGFNFFIFLR